MPAATLTSKGQTTIPKAVREYLRLRPGDRMECIWKKMGAWFWCLPSLMFAN